MPRRKKVKIDDIKGFENNDDSLIVHLPIKTNLDSKNNNHNHEIKKLQTENKELKETLALLMKDSLNNVKVIKNKNKNFIKTNKKCWWCGGNSTESIILPNKKLKNKFYGHGTFCSYNCALAYNFEKNDEKVWDRCSLLYQLRDIMTGKTNQEKIYPAPPKEILLEFGGEMNRDEYNNLLLSIDFSYLKLMHPMVSSTILIEQRNKNTQELNQMNLLGLKLQRTKNPLKNKSSLDSLIQLN